MTPSPMNESLYKKLCTTPWNRMTDVLMSVMSEDLYDRLEVYFINTSWTGVCRHVETSLRRKIAGG